MTTKELITKITSKKGLIAEIAKLYSNNEKKSEKYIRGLKTHYLYTPDFRNHFGEEICKEIEEYCKK